MRGSIWERPHTVEAARPLAKKQILCLELVFQRQFQNALRRSPGFLVQNTEVVRVRIWVGGYIGSKGLGCIVGIVVQSHLAVPAELGQRVVQPVECGSTELDSVAFRYVEGFISSQIADEQ